MANGIVVSAFTRGVNGLLHHTWVYGLRHSCVALTRVVNGLQHLAKVFGPQYSCDTLSREVPTAYCTYHVCRVYGAAA